MINVDADSRAIYVLDDGLLRSSGYRERPNCQHRYDCGLPATHLMMWDFRTHVRSRYRTGRMALCQHHVREVAAFHGITCPIITSGSALGAPQGEPNDDKRQ